MVFEFPSIMRDEDQVLHKLYFVDLFRGKNPFKCGYEHYIHMNICINAQDNDVAICSREIHNAFKPFIT